LSAGGREEKGGEDERTETGKSQMHNGSETA
jgi:hypothetical protein